MKYHIEKNTVQETLIIPLYARKICSEEFPQLFQDPDAERICDSLDYDFSAKEKLMKSKAGLFGAMEAAQRHYDLICEVKDYLKTHPKAAVVNLGCGLDDTFSKVDNGQCRGYNIDFEDVIKIRSEFFEAKEREINIGCDLNDFTWMDQVDGTQGAVFFAAGVFYYFTTDKIRELFCAMAEKFPGGVLVFDSCNRKGAKMMTKTWLKEAGITDVSALFSLENPSIISSWSSDFESVSWRSYMRGYRDLYHQVSLIYKLLILMCDKYVNMNIVRIGFRNR